MKQQAETPAQDKALGSQIMIDFYGCRSGSLDDLEWVENVSLEAACCAGVAIVDVVFHRLKPNGVAGVILVPESQLTVRTWPDYRYAAIDIFTRQGAFDSAAVIAQLGARLGCASRTLTTAERGKATELVGYLTADGTARAPERTTEGAQRRYPFQF